MRKIGIVIVFFFCLCLGSLVEAAKSYVLPTQPEIRVGLWDRQANLMISGERDFLLKNLDTGKFIGKYKAGEKIFLTFEKGKILLNGRAVNADRMQASLQKPEEAAGLEVNKKSYRGVIEISNVKKEGIRAVNVVGLEAYLYGIVAAEMPSAWRLEAVKAQAVAARTFALRSMQKHAAEGYDVCTATHCQVYGGKGAESEKAVQAVNDTRGLVLLYKNQPIHAVFHSSSGGRTENSEEAWGQAHPYLRSVEDFDQQAPFYRWETQMLPKEVEEKLNLSGYKIGILQAVEVSPLAEYGENQADRSATGRIRHIRFIGDQSSIEVSGAEARRILGLKSALFDIKLIVPEEEKITVPIGWRYRKEIDIALPPYEEKKGLPTDGPNMRRLHGRVGETFVFEGRGWGHGVGLSQWGAKQIAENGPEADDMLFKEILQHYYQGIEMKKVY